jgi:hypothetical protein
MACHLHLPQVQAGQTGTLSFDMLSRISLVLGIYKALHILYPQAELADQWIKLRNANPLLGGKPPLELMIDGGIDGLHVCSTPGAARGIEITAHPSGKTRNFPTDPQPLSFGRNLRRRRRRSLQRPQPRRLVCDPKGRMDHRTADGHGVGGWFDTFVQMAAYLADFDARPSCGALLEVPESPQLRCLAAARPPAA